MPPGGLWREVGARSWPLLAAYASLCGAFVLQAPQVFPSGGDPGHMVYLGQSIEGLASHPPLVPALLGLAHALSASSFEALSFSVKAFGALSLGVFAYGLHRLTAALSPRPLAASTALVLATVNPLALYELLWGGLAQFWGMAFACLALASALRWHEGPRCRIFTVAWSLATWYAHWYTGAFAVAAVGAVLLAQRAWTAPDRAEWARLASASVVGAIPLAWLYANLAPDLRLMEDVRAIGTLSYVPGIGSMIAKRPVIVAGSALMLLTAAAWGVLRLRSDRPPRSHIHFAIGWGAGFIVLLAGTPASLAGRAFYFLPILLIPMVAIASTDAFQGKAHLVGALAAAGAVVMAGGAFAAYHDDQPFFNPLDETSARAFQDLGAAKGSTAVFSPIANVDAWWLEAVTGRPALGTDAARYYARESEVAALDVAMQVAAGEHVLDVGPAFVATSPTHGLPAPLSVWVRDRQNPVPVLFFEESGAMLVGAGGATALGAPDDVEGAAEVAWRTPAGVVRRSIDVLPGAVIISYEVPPGTTSVELPAGPGWGGAFGTRNGMLAHHWPKDDATTVLALAPPPATTDTGRILLHLEAINGTARLVLPLHAPDTGAKWNAATAIAAAHGMDAVYARAAPPSLVARFDADAAFQQRFRQGDVVTWDRGGAR